MEWIEVVKKAKRLSTSLIFSKRNYVMCKLLLHSKRMTKILVQYYNVIMQRNFYPSRWLDVLDVMLDKGKGPIVRRLRTIQLIEADL